MKNTATLPDDREPRTVLATDIGGTHSRFALFRVTPPADGVSPCAVQMLRRVTFRTAEHNNTGELFARLFKDGSEPALLTRAKNGRTAEGLAAATLAIPAATKGRSPFRAPTPGECCPCANIDWPICWSEAYEVLGIDTIHMINDFTAQGFACAALPESLEAEPVRSGTPYEASPLSLFGAGTGFEQCLILPGPAPVIFPAEGGHNLFPFEPSPLRILQPPRRYAFSHALFCLKQ